ncbi:hypothetical protein LXA43DRAFT_85909 [Ganoderma leucocontextum]|nr:hypothetical protein LXA43DRAFT_85909 [Ganoderma leucocontextum]
MGYSQFHATAHNPVDCLGHRAQVPTVFSSGRGLQPSLRSFAANCRGPRPSSLLTGLQPEVISLGAVTSLSLVIFAATPRFLAAVTIPSPCARRPFARATACMVIVFYLHLPGPGTTTGDPPPPTDPPANRRWLKSAMSLETFSPLLAVSMAIMPSALIILITYKQDTLRENNTSGAQHEKHQKLTASRDGKTNCNCRLRTPIPVRCILVDHGKCSRPLSKYYPHLCVPPACLPRCTYRWGVSVPPDSLSNFLTCCVCVGRLIPICVTDGSVIAYARGYPTTLIPAADRRRCRKYCTSRAIPAVLPSLLCSHHTYAFFQLSPGVPWRL